jgi:hypothetical protein
MAVVPIATPMMAVKSGRPAASNDASVMASTTYPTISEMPSEFAVLVSSTRPPLNSTCKPAARAGSALSASSSRASEVISSDGTG